MKFAKSISLTASIAALTLVAVPVTSSAMQQQPQQQPATATAEPAPQPVAPLVVIPAPISPLDVAEAQLAADAADLDPGEFVWRPELAPAGGVEVVVSIPQQRAYIYRANRLIGVSTVSTGMRGHRTPTGRYPIM